MEAYRLDKEAQLGLLHELYHVAGQYLIVMKIDEVEMDDILQETMLTAWRKLETLKDVEKAEAWIRSIARNKARKYFRRRAKYWERYYFYGNYDWGLSEEDGEEITEIDLRLEEALIYEEMECFQDTEIYEMVQALGAPGSIILSLHYGYQETYDEIARTLGMKPGTVRSIASRSMAKLREWIEEKGRF